MVDGVVLQNKYQLMSQTVNLLPYSSHHRLHSKELFPHHDRLYFPILSFSIIAIVIVIVHPHPPGPQERGPRFHVTRERRRKIKTSDQSPAFHSSTSQPPPLNLFKKKTPDTNNPNQPNHTDRPPGNKKTSTPSSAAYIQPCLANPLLPPPPPPHTLSAPGKGS